MFWPICDLPQLLRLPTADCRLPTADCRLPTADCRLPTADCRLPTADCRLPTADCRLPTADCRLPTADCRLPTADCRLPTADCRLPTADCRLPKRPTEWLLPEVFAQASVESIPAWRSGLPEFCRLIGRRLPDPAWPQPVRPGFRRQQPSGRSWPH